MALLDKLIKAEDKGALLFGNEATILGEIKRNQNDAVKYFGDKGQLGYGGAASVLRTTITDIRGFLMFSVGLSQMFMTTVGGETIKKSGGKSAIEVTKILLEATKKIYGKSI